MTAREILSPGKTVAERNPVRTVEADMPLLELLPRLLDTPGREVGVNDGGIPLGVVDQTSMLEGLARMIAPRDDCSEVTVECLPEDYSASVLAHAVEDSDAHLVDLFSTPSADGRIRVTLRLRHSDPSAAVRSLERYDFKVLEAHGSSDVMRDSAIAAERLMALQALLNV
ncbi:MAG: hypothetical protein K2I16_07935 [Muribaculaceae bacterium]|nr:hypothetical protein [Muribaculaceae bacterium]